MQLSDTHKRFGPAFRRAGITTRDAVDEVLPAISRGLNREGHRFDLRVHRNATHRREGLTCAEVSYSDRMGFPSPQDLTAVVERHYPGQEVVFDGVKQAGSGVLSVPMRMAGDRIPVSDPSRIPEGFRHVAAGVYIRADAAGVRWSLERDAGSGQFALVRLEDEPEAHMGELQTIARAKAARPKVGQAVQTPDGTGVMVDRAPDGTPIVEVAGRRYRYLEAQVESKKDPGLPDNAFGSKGYDANRDRKFEKRYYEWLYGPEFADGMVREFPTG